MTRKTDNSNKQPAEAATGTMAERVAQIRMLEDRLVGLKQDLLLSTATVTPDTQTTDLNFLLLKIDEHTLAAPISFVEEVVEMAALTSLRKDVETVAGLLNYHGDMIAVIDVAQLVGVGKSTVDASKAMVICHIEPRTFALMVDEAIEVVTTDPDAIVISDEVLPGLLKASGILKLPDGGTAFIMDLGWLAIGAQLAGMLSADAATPVGENTP